MFSFTHEQMKEIMKSKIEPEPPPTTNISMVGEVKNAKIDDAVCHKCLRVFKNKNGLNIHQRKCLGLNIEKGQSFFKTYAHAVSRPKEYDVSNKILPLTQELICNIKDDVIMEGKNVDIQKVVDRSVEKQRSEKELCSNDEIYISKPILEKQKSGEEVCSNDEIYISNSIIKESVKVQSSSAQCSSKPTIEIYQDSELETDVIFKKKSVVEFETSENHFAYSNIKKQDKVITRDYDTEYLRAKVNESYREVMNWRRNVFDVPKGKVGKEFVKEMTLWVDRWCNKTKYHDFCFEALFIMPNILLQRTNDKLKSKEIKVLLDRRLMLWKEGKIIDLLKEGRLIQKRLPKIKKNNEDDIVETTKKN